MKPAMSWAASTRAAGSAMSSMAVGVLLGLPGVAAAAVNRYAVASPKAVTSIEVSHDTVAGTLSYTVRREGQVVIDASALGLSTSVADFSSGLAFVARKDQDIRSKYTLPGHKHARYKDNAQEMTLRFSRNGQELQLVVRAYDDGVAYRYALPGSGALTVSAERSAFNLPDTATGWAQSYTVNYEGKYEPRASFNSGSFGMPVLAQVGGQWLLLSESDVGSSFHTSRLDGASGNTLRVVPPSSTPASGTRPFATPWRVAMVGGLDTIVESTLIENLSAKSQIADTSWIQPGRSGWSWRAGGVQSNYDTHPPYVDQAAAMGWEYYLVDEGWQASWVPTLVDYGRARGVGIVLWAHHHDVDTEAKARTVFAQWAAWGVRGAKIDFFDSDSQAIMQLEETLARVAAEYKLVLNLHGATKPNGLERKWPNLLTQEGVFGAEQGGLPGNHNVSLVFTRNAIGPMDYTPVNWSTATGHTTWAHQTALSIVFSSYQQHYADHWAMYRDNLSAELLRAVPVVWDDTRLLEGQPDQYATLARQRGSEWFVGSIAGNAARNVGLPLKFLAKGVTYTAQIYRDGGSDNEIVRETRSVKKGDVLNLAVRANGGFAVRFTTQAPPVALANLAAGKAATADSSSSANEGPRKAANGSVAAGSGDKWCSGGASKWLQLDLGAVYSLSHFALRHAEAGGEKAAWNTRDFAIDTSTDGTTWSTAVNVSGNTAAATSHAVSARDARYVRLRVTTGAQPGEGNVARIYELEAYGQGRLDTRAYFKLVNRNSGKVLAVQNAALGDSAAVVQWDYADATTNDEWRAVDAGAGYWAIVNRYSGRVLDVKGALTDDGTGLIQYTSRGSANQQWQPADTDGGFQRLTSRASGKVADIYERLLDNGAAAIIWPWSGGTNQQWQWVPVANIP